MNGHSVSDDEDDGPIMKSRPRRRFEVPSMTSSPMPTLDTRSTGPTHETSRGSESGGTTPSRSRSILNLTSSTLFGIYQPTGYDINQDGATPWGTGAQTPAQTPSAGRPDPLDISRADFGVNGRSKRPGAPPLRRHSTMPRRQRRGFRGYFLPLAGRTVALAVAGVLYGLLISHLHDNQQIAPVHVDLDRSTRRYFVFWAVAGVVLGEAFPRADLLWASEDSLEIDEAGKEPEQSNSRGVGAWNDVIRSIGAFVGIAFAIRKLPWQSTLQLSLTLAMANPAVWYLIDRSPPGFALSALFSLSGTAMVMAIYPGVIPTPSPSPQLFGRALNMIRANGTGAALTPDELVLGVFSQEFIGVATWIASVLFVSSVCFGNIGRRLAPERT